MEESVQTQPKTPSAQELQDALRAILPATDQQHTTLGNVRFAMEQHFQLSPGTLKRKEDAIDV